MYQTVVKLELISHQQLAKTEITLNILLVAITKR